MRGTDDHSGSLFSYVDLEARVPADHPLRPIRALVDEALLVLSPDFERLYSKTGRPSIAPEKLLRALLLQAFFTIRSERQLMDQLDYNLLFRWFVGLSMDERVWDATVYSKNRDRLVAGDVAARLLQAVLQCERVRRLLSDEHFSVDGTLIEAWASMKSFRPKEGGDDDAPGTGGRNAGRDFRGERRSNGTHASSTDGDARLFRRSQGQSSRLCFMGHLLMENGNALIVDAELTQASGTAERDAALAMVGRRRKGRRTTLGADKGYDVADFVDTLRGLAVTPHIAVDGHATKTRHRGLDRVGWMFALAENWGMVPPGRRPTRHVRRYSDTSRERFLTPEEYRHLGDTLKRLEAEGSMMPSAVAAIRLLDRLKRLLKNKGFLSGFVIDEADNMPSSGTYAARFGSLVRAYSLVGFTPERDYQYIEINRALRQKHATVVAETIAEIERIGGAVSRDPITDLLTVNDEFTASIVLSRCKQTEAGSKRWKIRLDTGLAPDLTVALRMDGKNEAVLDYYLLPLPMLDTSRIRLAEENGLMLDGFRFETLEYFFAMAERALISELVS